MVILKKNVRTKAGLLPAGTDVEGKLSDEVIADLVKNGLASIADKNQVEEGSDNASDSSDVETSAEEQQETEQSDDESTETSEEVEETEESADDVDLNLPDTSKTTKTTTRGRGRKSK